jgi:hypothetical protein
MSAPSIPENRLIDLINLVLDQRLPRSNNTNGADHGTAAYYDIARDRNSYRSAGGRSNYSVRRDDWLPDRGGRDTEPRSTNFRRQTSPNTDHGRLVQSLNLHVRTIHAIGNWGNAIAPRSIRRRMSDVFESINPPGCDDSFRAAIRSMQDRHQAEIANLVEFSLRDKLDTITAKINKLNQKDRERAEETVRHQLRNLRITPEALDEALAATRVPASYVASEQQQPPATDQLNYREPPPPADSRTEHVTDQSPSPPIADQFSHREPPPPAVQMTDDVTDLSPSPPPSDTARRDPPTRTPSESQRRQRRSSPVDSSRGAHQPWLQPARRLPTLAAGGRVFVVEKASAAGWSFRLTPSRSVTTIVIADSNGVRWRNVPDDWLVLACPEAKLQDVQSIVESIRLQPTVTTIVLALGANNRTESRSTLEDVMKRLRLFTSQFISVDFCFFGVPSLDRSSSLEEEGSNVINRLAKHEWPANYITVPVDFPVRYINPNDVFHYNENTADRYILAVQNFIPSL